MTKIIVTGRTSFIGRHFIQSVPRDWEIYSIERLPVRLCPSNVRQIFHDLRAEIPQRVVDQVRGADYLVHFAADVSGIKSLSDPRLSVTTNVVGTFNVLELARKLYLKKFIQVSTGEVLGSVSSPFVLGEDAPLRPSNPYAASKAAAEALANSYNVSFGVPTVIVRSMNVFGTRQSNDRFVPGVLKSLHLRQPIKCHVGEDGTVGSRNWLHVHKFVDAIVRLAKDGKIGEIYHVVGPERNNQEIIHCLAEAVKINAVVEPMVAGASHDLRYALKDTKLGYNFDDDFEETLVQTARRYDPQRVWLR